MTIGVNTITFALCFALWVLFGPATKAIAKEFHLSASVASLLKAAPILVGSLFRMPIGMITDRLGARVMFPSVMLAGALAAFSVSFATSPSGLIAGAFVLGIIGTSFAVGVQSISAVTERKRQGFALGIFGVGNVGTAITTFSLPILLTAVGWRWSFRYAAGVIACGAVAYFLTLPRSKRNASPPPFRVLIAPLGDRRTWLFGLYYMATFGAFVASVLILSDIYSDAYKISAASAGLLATAFSIVASVTRMPGGILSDRFGAQRVLRLALMATVFFLLPVLAGPPVVVTFCCMLLAGTAMGIGSAATFKLIPEYFPNAVGAVGGSVGAIGGLAGFFLPQIASALKPVGGVYLQLLPLVLLAAATLAAQVFSNRQRTAPDGGSAVDLTALAQATGTKSDEVSPVGDSVHGNKPVSAR